MKKFSTQAKNNKIQNEKKGFYVFTKSVPIESKTKTGFRSAIVSAVYLENLELNHLEFFDRMMMFGLRKYNLVFITVR